MSDQTVISHTETEPASQSELSRLVKENSAGRAQAIYPVGGRTALHYGRPVANAGMQLSTAKLNRVVDFPARDMTITVEAGIRMEDLAATIAAERLQLPIDVPQRNRATLGGGVACNTSGPRRYGYGTLRDYVIGVSAVDASGRSFKAGGRVVKNVAGYDLCKLLVGSLGSIAVISQLTLKLKPIPEVVRTLWVEVPGFEAADALLERVIASDARPTTMDVLSATTAGQIVSEARLEMPADNPALVMTVEGTEKEVAWQLQRLRDELAAEWPRSINDLGIDESARLLDALTEFPIGAEEPLTFRASLPPSRTMRLLQEADEQGISCLAHAGNGIVVGHLSDEATTAKGAAEILAPIIRQAESAGGGFVVLNCAASWKSDLPTFGHPGGSWSLMQRLKRQLDPRNLLSPGRLFESP